MEISSVQKALYFPSKQHTMLLNEINSDRTAREKMARSKVRDEIG
jgi:hypothetical protein